VKQALKSSVFWYIALAFTYYFLLVGVVITHLMPCLSSIGIARSISGLMAAAIPLTSVVERLGLGWLGGRHNKKLIAASTFDIIGFGAFFFGFASIADIWLLVPFLALFGISYGGCILLRGSLVRDYFGRTGFGTVFSLILGINMLGGMTGPLLAVWVPEDWGSYQHIWFIFAGLSIVALVSTLAIRPAGALVQLRNRI
jgi:MFS family permease